LLGARGHARAVRSATDAQTLLALADMARIAGEPVSAALALERLIERHPRHAEAALSALMLGRIELDDLDRPARAVRALQRALDGGLPAALQEDALARLVEAAARAGDTTTATRAASEHRRRFPTGRWRARVDRFVEPP
jgi:transmembrane sensor